MSLNNNGWGYREMLIYVGILCCFLLLAAFLINQLYADLEKQSQTSTETDVIEPVVEEKEETQQIVDLEYYLQLENNLKIATLEYMNNNPYDLSQNILNVSLETLVDAGYIDSLYDQIDNQVCQGYSNVLNGDENVKYEVRAYIKCSNYTTEGY